MSPRIAVLARCLGLSVLCLGLSLGCTDSATTQKPPPEVEGVVDAAASTVVVDRPTGVLANGSDFAVVTVTALRKADGSRLSGRSVSLTVEGEGASVLESALVTDITGVAQAHVTSTVPGVKTVKASVKDDTGKMTPLTATATVDFADVNTVRVLAFRSALPDAVAGEPLKLLAVEVRNGAGEVATDSTAEVTLSLGSGGIVFPEGLLTVAAVNGVATFPDVVLKKAGGGYHFIANAPGFEPVTSTVFTVVPGAVAALGYDRFLDTATVGVAQDLEVTLADAYANPVTTYTGTVKLTSTDSAATLTSHTFTPADAGRFKFQGITFRTAGRQFLTIADSAGDFSFEQPVDVAAAAASKLVFTQQPASPVSTRASLGDVKVAVQDAFGNPVSATGLSVKLSLPAGAFTLAGTVSAAPVDGVATFTGLSIAGHGTTHLVASAQGLQDVSSSDVQVVDDVAPAKPVLTQTGATETGLTVQWTGVGDDGVQGQLASQELRYSMSAITSDAAFNAATPVTVAAPVPAGTVQSETLSGLTPGKTYHVALKVTDAHGNSARSDSLAVSTADPQVTQLAFTPQPSNGTAGSALADVHVSLLDSRGDVVSTATTAVTLTLTGQSGFQAVTVEAVDGVATFAGLSVNKAGTFTFTATAGALTRESQTFTVGAGAAAKLVLAAFADPVDAGDSNDVTVSVTDAFGNPIQGYTGTVHFTSSDAQAELPADVTFVQADQGEKTVSGLVFKTAGTQSLTATDTATPALTATVNAEVRAITAASLEVVASAGPFGAGQSLSYELVARDTYGNVAKDYASTVTVTSSDAQAVLPGAYTFTLLDEGRHTFNVELRTAGDQSVSAEDVADPSLTASHTYAIVPAAVGHLTFASAPTTGSVRHALGDIKVAVKDAYGNTLTDASADVQLALVGGGFAQGIPTRTTVSGVATFGALSINDEGSYQLQASANGFQTLTSADLIISDEDAPAAVSGFSATAVDGASIRLDWQAPGDDGVLGTAAHYELRYATFPLNDATFGVATLVTGVGAPRTAGTAESFTVTGLTESTTYHFALRTFDGAGNASVLATASTATTNPCDGYVCTPPAPECAEDGYSREVYASVCVVRNGAPTCVDGDSTLEVCTGANAVCYAGECTHAPHPGAGELVISEVMHSPSAGTTEYLELTNTTSHLLDAQGLMVTLVNGAGTETSFTVNHNPTLLVPPGGRTVLAQDANYTRNGGVPANTDYGIDKFMDSTGSITLKQGAVTVDSLTYTNAVSPTTGRAMSLASSIIGTKGSSRAWYWCESTGSLPGGDRGTPGQANDDCGLNVEKPVNRCAIQSPKTFPSPDNAYPTFITTADSYDIFSQFYSYDVTTRNTKGNDFYPRIEAQLGYGTDATNPAGWTWNAADFDPGFTTPNSNDDQMKAVLQIPALGTYSYGFRYRFTDAGAPWVYCDQFGKVDPSEGTWGTVRVSKAPLLNHVVISEVSGGNGSGTAATDEFIELYNPTNSDVDLSNWQVGYKSATGSWNSSVTIPAGRVVRAHGYFLLGGANYSGTGVAMKDLGYTFDMSASTTAGGHVRIQRLVGSTYVDVDLLGWGTGDSPEGGAGNAAPSHPAVGGSLERKAVSASTSTSMAVGGADAARGNGQDTDNNKNDFVTRAVRQPQTSQSPLEFY
ncbi:Ig-like domain-containing protein [Corallococcus coralloides DSM 2259]|uniref:Ig-like domain-containing protein n=1 Tax=Corallococcus coralloides (strain ATCC 25202 / DSM 2259 / NBRC 100086 / M2) TaxID=1144275 RepID=H8MRG1_CORCM|nr:lamin tail domain-containing protein [Corallococcus coralloides]AFE06876.1 Ig-like domain-containing protein [Corallococcus coralloides DSM 2259]